MKRQRAEISSNVISYIKSAHPIEMWRSNKLGIKEKISRGKFPRLIFSCPVPSGLPHRSHCVPMNMNPWFSGLFEPFWYSLSSRLSLAELRSATSCFETVLKFFNCRFSLIFRAFPAFCFSVIRCADHKKRPFFIQRQADKTHHLLPQTALLVYCTSLLHRCP